MIRIENIELEMRVITKIGHGIVKDLYVSDANRCYAVVELDNGIVNNFPIDVLCKL